MPWSASPSFKYSATVVVIIAVAMGFSVALFSLVKSLSPQALDVPKASEIRFLQYAAPDGQRGLPLDEIREIQKQQTLFTHLAATIRDRAQLVGGRTERWMSGETVDYRYFETIGVGSQKDGTLLFQNLSPPFLPA